MNVCDIAGCSEVLILREFLEGCDRTVGCSSCMLCYVQHSKIVETFLLQLDHGKPKRKNCFRILLRRRTGFASESQGSTWWTLISISCTMMFYLFWNQTCNFSPCFITRLVDKPHEILWKNSKHLFLVFWLWSIKQLLHQPRFKPTGIRYPPKLPGCHRWAIPPWMRRKWVVSGRHARICHRHCGGVWVWWANNQPVGGFFREGQRLRGVHFKGFPV